MIRRLITCQWRAPAVTVHSGLQDPQGLRNGRRIGDPRPGGRNRRTRRRLDRRGVPRPDFTQSHKPPPRFRSPRGTPGCPGPEDWIPRAYAILTQRPAAGTVGVSRGYNGIRSYRGRRLAVIALDHQIVKTHLQPVDAPAFILSTHRVI